MPACTFISNLKRRAERRARLVLVLWVALLSAVAIAADTPSSGGADSSADPRRSSSPGVTAPLSSPDEDYSQTPYTAYGEFNQDEEEENDTRFFQYGRFFGVGLGVGFEGVSGNRGRLWQGGMPLIDFKLTYWFDFNLALALGYHTAPHNFRAFTTKYSGPVNVNLSQLGADIRYYFDTKNLSAALSFANPYVLVGLGAYSKRETFNGATESDSNVGFRIGGGLEFPIRHRKLYFTIEPKLHFVNFEDTNLDEYSVQCQTDPQSPCLPDLSGVFYTVTAGFLFTW